MTIEYITRAHSMKYQIVKYKHFLDIPSGSGIEIDMEAGRIYIMGDDSCFLYLLDTNWTLVEAVPIYNGIINEKGRIAKKDKADLEAMTFWEEEGKKSVFLIGSGSKSPQRDFGYRVYPNETVVKVDFSILYSHLREELSIRELNIEAAIQWEGQLVLFIRGGTFQESALVLVEDKSYEMISIKIPLINNVPAGISGATYWREKDILFFCASAESTANAYDDGQIGGSLVGEIKDFSDKLKKKELVINDFVILGEIPQQKIESIAISGSISDTEIVLLAIADNDDGTSYLFEISLSC